VTGRPCPDLSEEADIVPTRPVLDDDAVDNPPDVDVGPRDGRSCGLGSREQWHGRGLVAAVHRHVVDHELAFSDEVVVIDCDLFTEIVHDRREDLFPTLSALRTAVGERAPDVHPCGVVHQVFGDKFVDDAVITGHSSTKQFFDDILRFPGHPLILPARHSFCHESRPHRSTRWECP
jgi:hypothetical protein